jgi:hypothetical protein
MRSRAGSIQREWARVVAEHGASQLGPARRGRLDQRLTSVLPRLAPTLTLLVMLSSLAGCIPFVHHDAWVLAINETSESYLLRMNTGAQFADWVVAIGPNQTAQAWTVERSTVVVIELLTPGCDVIGRVSTTGTGSEKVWIRSDGLHGPEPATDSDLDDAPNLAPVAQCERDFEERSSGGLP